MRLRLSTPAEVRRSLSKIANMTANGEMDTKTANSIVTACNAILSSIRTDEDERRIDELEERLDEVDRWNK